MSHLSSKSRYFVLTCLFFIILPYQATSSRILVSIPWSSKSHRNTILPLIDGLAQRNHSLTIISNEALPAFRQYGHVKQIVLDGLSVEDVSKSRELNLFEILSDTSPFAFVKHTLQHRNMSLDISWKMYSNGQVEEMLRKDQFDLVISSQITSYCGYPLAWHFQCPVLLSNPNVLFGDLAFVLGDHEHTEYVPFMLSSYTDRMTLIERTINTLITHSFAYFQRWMAEKSVEDIIRLFLPDVPTFTEMDKNLSVIFTNSHPSMNYPRALPPTVIEIGSLHCRPAKPLPQDLEEFVAGSGDDGFLVFGVGSMIPMNKMPSNTRDTFIRVFSGLRQRIVWQWKDSNISDLPSNIRLMDWLPQQDLLGHPKCKGFLSHGGLLSTQEAVYHGVPVIGLPFITDQRNNLNHATDQGYAVQLHWNNINQDNLHEAIQQIVYNSSYRDNVKKLQSLLLDQPQTPLERGIYWTEYVIRHRGAPHLRLASRDLSRFQRSLLDVYLVLISIAFIPCILFIFCLRCLFNKCQKAPAKSVKMD